MDRMAAKQLPPGSDEHYTAFVGPPDQWDVMGAMQLRLAWALGLREHHHLLDVGCGSLRAGRFFILYLDPGHYCGIDPNQWLVTEAIRHELGGEDLVRLKAPRFSDTADFDTLGFDTTFDFILAQSVFSHAGPDLIDKGLRSFHQSLAPDGLVMATFITPPGSADFAGWGWVYPGCVSYAEETVLDLARAAGLAGRRIPFFHPRQDWYLFARNPDRLPSPAEAERHLTGHVFNVPDFVDQRPARP